MNPARWKTKNRGKLTLLVLMLLLLSTAIFALGAYVHKSGWHRPILNPVLNAIHNRVGFTCNRQIVDGYCPTSSKFKFQPYENNVINQLDTNEPEFSLQPVKRFEELLKEALGWDTFQLLQKDDAEKITTEKTEKYEDGVLEKHFINYSFPRLTLRYYHAIRSAKELVVVLHGHNSSALKVMGIDYEDYMRQAGKEWFKSGYDVIAFDLTTNSEKSAYINSQLSLYGGQIYGLWSRVVCDTMQNPKIRERYTKVFLHGLSNGGVIADYVSVLCGQLFDKIIVDEALADWRKEAWRNPSLWGPQNYAIYYLAPLLRNSSFIDLIVNSKSQKYYTMRSRWLEPLALKLRDVLRIQKGIAHDKKVNFVDKKLDHHVTELEVIGSIFQEKDDLTGYHLP